jgi:predicted transcriptional regulator
MAQMPEHIKVDRNLWSKFAEEAKKSRKDPTRLLSEVLREYLDRKERQRLLNESIRQAKRSGLSEDDDIEGMIKALRKKRLAKT